MREGKAAEKYGCDAVARNPGISTEKAIDAGVAIHVRLNFCHDVFFVCATMPRGLTLFADLIGEWVRHLKELDFEILQIFFGPIHLIKESLPQIIVLHHQALEPRVRSDACVLQNPVLPVLLHAALG